MFARALLRWPPVALRHLWWQRAACHRLPSVAPPAPGPSYPHPEGTEPALPLPGFLPPSTAQSAEPRLGMTALHLSRLGAIPAQPPDDRPMRDRQIAAERRKNVAHRRYAVGNRAVLGFKPRSGERTADDERLTGFTSALCRRSAA